VIRVKICGLRRPEDVEAAIESGADALGFVMEPTSPRCVLKDPDMAVYLPRMLAGDPFNTVTVAVFGPNAPVRVEGFDFVQAHSFTEGPESFRILSIRPKARLTNWWLKRERRLSLWKAIPIWAMAAWGPSWTSSWRGRFGSAPGLR
jgi:phosphoribosylanthranilate isomerase